MDRLLYLSGETITVRDGMEARPVTPEEADAIRDALPGEAQLPWWLDASAVLFVLAMVGVFMHGSWK